MRSKSKIWLLMFITVLVFIAMGIYPRFFAELTAQQRESRRDKRKGLIPIPLADEEPDIQKRLDREKKNRKYNSRYGEDLTTQSPGEIFGRVSERPPSIPLPVNESDLVVVGKIIKVQPYLSESRNFIYSEFSVQIEDVLKQNDRNLVTSGSSVTIDKEGGAIIMPNGQVIQYVVTGIGALPELNSRYLFFLRKVENQEEYVILTGYELNADGILPLEDYQDREIFRGKSEKNFVNEVKNRIAGSKTS